MYGLEFDAWLGEAFLVDLRIWWRQWLDQPGEHHVTKENFVSRY
jgi:hypothetical protein